MDPDRWKKIEHLCYKAGNLSDSELKTFLADLERDNKKLSKELKSLLEQSDNPLLQSPLVHIRQIQHENENLTDSSRTIGPYRIIRTLGFGGMGEVYLAIRDDDEFEQFVALKVIRKGLVSEEVLKKFYQERQILADLNHPGIARLFDGGTTPDGLPWFAMEYIEGETITDYCNLRNLTLDKCIALFIKVCKAVQYAHQNLVVHHDLKPANIIITPGGDPKLLDFGIAKLMTLSEKSARSEKANKILTPEYCSPEQIANHTVSTTSDVYSLGVLLYKLLTNQLPYHFKNLKPDCIEQTICRTDPAVPSSVSGLAALKGDLDCIIMKALRKDPADRYASVEQLKTDLVRYEQSLPISVRTSTIPYRLKKFSLRHKWGIGASAVILIVLMAFFTITIRQSRAIQARSVEVEKQRNRAEQISEYLTELFKSVDPSEAKDKSLTAVELLKRGVSRIENELPDQPVLQARLYLLSAEIYDSMGMYKEGLKLAQKAHRLHLTLHNEPHSDIASSLNIRGWLYRQLGDYEKADSNLTAALAMRKQLFDTEHLDVARSLNDLAVLRQSEGKYAATDTLLKQAITIRKALVGDQHESVAVALSNYAALNWRLGEITEAVKLSRESLDVFRHSVGTENTRVATVMTNLAALLLMQNKKEEAEKFYRQALKIRLKLVGENHPDVAYSYAHLGNLLRSQGAFEEAEDFLTKALHLRRQLLGENHILTGDSRRVLGYLYQEIKNYEAAEKQYLKALETFQNKFDEGHARTAQMLHTVGELYTETNTYEKAKTYFQKAYQMRTHIFGDQDSRTVQSMLKLGICLAELGQNDKAENYLIAGIDVLKQSGNNSSTLLNEAEKVLAEITP